MSSQEQGPCVRQATLVVSAAWSNRQAAGDRRHRHQIHAKPPAIHHYDLSTGSSDPSSSRSTPTPPTQVSIAAVTGKQGRFRCRCTHQPCGTPIPVLTTLYCTVRTFPVAFHPNNQARWVASRTARTTSQDNGIEKSAGRFLRRIRFIQDRLTITGSVTAHLRTRKIKREASVEAQSTALDHRALLYLSNLPDPRSARVSARCHHSRHVYHTAAESTLILLNYRP